MSSSFSVRSYDKKKEFQSLLGKLLYIARCVRASRIFLNRSFMSLREQCSKSRISLDAGTLESLSWFVSFMKEFNGVTRFNKFAVQHHIYVDANFQRLGGAWGSRVYSTLIPTDVIGQMSITQYEMYNILLSYPHMGQ